jgi:hypothetical protein
MARDKKHCTIFTAFLSSFKLEEKSAYYLKIWNQPQQRLRRRKISSFTSKSLSCHFLRHLKFFVIKDLLEEDVYNFLCAFYSSKIENKRHFDWNISTSALIKM